MSGDDDVIDLEAARRARQRLTDEDAGEEASRIKARDGEVELVIRTVAGKRIPESGSLTLTPEGARQWAHLLLAESWKAERQLEPACRACGRRGCRMIHVGQRYRFWHRGRRVIAVVDRRCSRSWRLRELGTGQKIYRRSLSHYDLEGWGADLELVE